MKSIYLSFMVMLLFAACNSDDQGKKIGNREKTALRPFSDSAKADTFRIVLNGNKPKEMELVFSITKAGGGQIYTQTLKAAALLDNYKETVDLNKEKQQIQFMQEELNLFFEDENFIEPAVTETEEPDENTPDKSFFAELKKSGLNGFKYRLGKESKVYIAWSDLDKKVKIYYQCCK